MTLTDPFRSGAGNPFEEVDRLEERCRQLERALESRVLIEQAKGAVSARSGVEIDIAFAMIRGLARSQRREIHEFCVDVIAHGGRLDGFSRASRSLQGALGGT